MSLPLLLSKERLANAAESDGTDVDDEDDSSGGGEDIGGEVESGSLAEEENFRGKDPPIRRREATRLRSCKIDMR